MLEILKFIHFVGMAVGIGGGLANLLAGMGLASVPPEARPLVGAFRANLGKLATGGLVLLWLTGLTLIWQSEAASLWTNPTFQLKLVAVIILSGLSVIANLAAIRAKRTGTPPDAQRMKKLGVASQLAVWVAVLFAVVTFN